MGCNEMPNLIIYSAERSADHHQSERLKNFFARDNPGRDADPILSQIVAEELKLPMEEVRMVAADTETTPVDIGSWISFELKAKRLIREA